MVDIHESIFFFIETGVTVTDELPNSFENIMADLTSYLLFRKIKMWTGYSWEVQDMERKCM